MAPLVWLSLVEEVRIPICIIYLSSIDIPSNISCSIYEIVLALAAEQDIHTAKHHKTKRFM
jgi:hypothetical protein